MKHLSPEFVAKQKSVLLNMEERLSGRRSHLPSIPESTGDIADAGNLVADADRAAALLTSGAANLKDVHSALRKIGRGTYGLCEMSGEPIPEARLEALPWARFTIKSQMEYEKSGRSRAAVNLFDADADEDSDEPGEE